MKPQYHILKRHGKTAPVLAAKFRADPSLRAEAINEISILEMKSRGGRIIDRCVTSREYCQTLKTALEMADESEHTPPS